MNEKFSTIGKMLIARWNSAFRERQIIFRSDRSSRYVVLSSRLQSTVAISLAVITLVSSVGMYDYYHTKSLVYRKDAAIERAEVRYKSLLDQVADYRSSMARTSAHLRDKQESLAKLFDQNETLRTHLSITERKLELTEDERSRMDNHRDAMHEQLSALEIALTEMSQENVQLEDGLNGLRSQLINVVEENRSLSETRSLHQQRIDDLEERLAKERGDKSGLQAEVKAMRMDMHKAMQARSRVLIEKSRAEQRIAELEDDLLTIEEKHRSRLRTIAERAMATIGDHQRILRKAGISIQEIAPAVLPVQRPVMKDSHLDPQAPISVGRGGPFIAWSSAQELEGLANSVIHASHPDLLHEADMDTLMNSIDHYLGRLAQVDRIMQAVPLGLPVDDYWITSRFGMRRDPINGRRARHSGLDLGGRRNAPIKSAADGVITKSGWMAGYGRIVEVDHGEGFKTRYAHLAKIISKRGDVVEEGDIVGLLGSSGRSTGPHLHYEVLRNGKPINPLRFIKAGRDVLEAK